jgi:hypothetical protein
LNDNNNDRVPIAERHRGVGIFGGQTRERIDAIVRPAIDAVSAESRIHHLVAYAADPCHPPEARLFAAARVEALYELAARERVQRPDVDLEVVRASVAGLNSVTWLDREAWRSDLDPPPGALMPR